MTVALYTPEYLIGLLADYYERVGEFPTFNQSHWSDKTNQRLARLEMPMPNPKTLSCYFPGLYKEAKELAMKLVKERAEVPLIKETIIHIELPLVHTVYAELMEPEEVEDKEQTEEQQNKNNSFEQLKSLAISVSEENDELLKKIEDLTKENTELTKKVEDLEVQLRGVAHTLSTLSEVILDRAKRGRKENG